MDIFFTKIAEQADGYMHKDGGPVIGIQIENEYGHAGGPSDREEGMAHMRTLTCHGGEKGTGSPVCVGNRLGWCLCAGKFPAGAGRVCGCPVGKSYP